MADEQELQEQALVRSGWEQVDLLGRLGESEARRLLADRWESERKRATETVQPVTPSPGGSQVRFRRYESLSNQARFRRTLDYVQPGERVFEIGLGGGYTAAVFLRDGGVGEYRGIDYDRLCVKQTRNVLEANGLADRAEVAIGDLYDLTPADLADFAPDLVVCCEVIEHLPDPEGAVKTLADALPKGAELLVSVPLLGRLESVWGHVAIFDAARARVMVEQAGLVIHNVSVVDNTWAFILASHDAAPSPRAARAAVAGATPAGAPADGSTPRSVHLIDLDMPDIGPSPWNRKLARRVISRTPDGLICELTSEKGRFASGTPYGGVRFPVKSPRGLRLELGLDDIDAVTAFYVDAAAADKRVARWKWDPSGGRPKLDPATFVLRPNRRGQHFQLKSCHELESADAFDVFVAIERGSSVRFRITRAAVIL